jgi:hypothetical protein
MKIHVHWMNLMKNQIIHNFKGLNFFKKGLQDKGLNFKPFNKKICSMGSKCLALNVDHTCRK